MKTILTTCLCSAALAFTALAQSPAETPDPAATTSTSGTTTPATSAAPAGTVARADEGDLESRIEKKVKHGLNISFGDEDRPNHSRGHRHDVPAFDQGALMAIPIVGIIFSTLFGAPVLIVGLILFFSYWKQRSLHRTVRMMVEKGQPVPEGLFAAPSTPARQRNDMRRGITLTMVGLGLMVFLGAVNDWEGGAWAVGLIPFLIGAGHLLVWKLEGNKAVTDNSQRLS